MDRYGLIDAEYEDRAERGQRLNVMGPDRELVTDAGRYMVVVDSGRASRPEWATHTGRRRPTR